MKTNFVGFGIYNIIKTHMEKKAMEEDKTSH